MTIVTESSKKILLKPRIKVWLEYLDRPIIGAGGARLLKLIDETNSISKAAEKMGVSYRFAWNYIKNVERTLKTRIVSSKKGGNEKGRTVLTPVGKSILREYEKLCSKIGELEKIVIEI